MSVEELDALFAERIAEGWSWTNREGYPRMFLPPEGDNRINWCAEWIPTHEGHVPHWVVRENPYVPKPKTAQELRDEHDNIKKQLNILRENLAAKLAETQAACDHSGIIYHTPYRTNTFFANDGPRRMCSICGLEEDDWRVGLNAKLPKEYNADVKLRTVTMSRDDFYKQRP